MTAELLDPLLKPGVTTREWAPDLFTTMLPDKLGAAYDDMAVAYDRMVSSDLYLKLAWGARRQTIISFMRDAFSAAESPILELAAGTCCQWLPVWFQPGCRTEVRRFLPQDAPPQRRGFQPHACVRL